MKKLAIIGAVIFLVGMTIFTSSMAVCGWDVRKISTTSMYQEKQYSAENNNQTIRLRDQNIPLFVGKSNNNQIHFIYFEHDKQYYNIDGTEAMDITIEKETNYHWYDHFFNIDVQTPYFSILLPSEFKGSLVLETSNGKITVNDVTLRQLQLTTSNGVVNIKNLTSAENVEIESSNSKIEVSDVNLTGKLQCMTNDGSINLSNVVAQNISATTSNNRIVATNTKTSQSTELRSSNNRIEIENVNAGENITLSTDNGKITGTIMGNMSDFSIVSKTSNGKNSLPENMVCGSKDLKATTTNAEISIQFTN